MMIKKIFKYLSLFVITLVASINVIKATDMVYDSYKVGDKITYNNMDFYVIADSDSKQDYVTLLKAEPLSVDEVNKYGKNHVNMYSTLPFLDYYQTAYSKNGYGGMAYYSSTTCGFPTVVSGTIVETGCTTDYEQSEIKFVVDAWAKDKLKLSDLKEDKMGYSTRLITKDELMENLGYHQVTQGPSTLILNSEYTPDWAYNGEYWYWTMSPLEDYSRVFVAGDNLFSISVHTECYVVRPVVNLKKTQYKPWSAKSFKIGDIIKYNDILFYVIKDSDENNAVTAIKAEPLTVDEINKYGKDHVNRYTYFSVGTAYNNNNSYGGMAYYSSPTCGYPIAGSHSEYTTTGCTTDYAKSEIKYVVDAWAVDKFQASDLSVDETGYSVRLLTIDELQNNFGYVYGSNNTSDWYENSDNTPLWLYNNQYSYWAMSQRGDSAYSVWGMGSNGHVYAYTVSNYSGLVRPVVTFSRKNRDSSTNDNSTNDNSTNDNSTTKVSVPDTLLNMPVLCVIIGIFILIVSLIIIYVILKNKHKNIKS